MIYFGHAQLQHTNWGPSVNIDNFITNEECSKIIGLMPDRKLESALVSEEGVKNTSIRSTKLCALDYNDRTAWIFGKLDAAISQINREIYGFDIHGIKEAVQLMQYAESDFYGWHADTGNLQFSRRKLSFSIQLSDASDYDGGELEFFRNGKAPKDRRTLVIFPSHLYHQVLPVTRGLRRAIVGWVDGPPLR